MSAYDEFFKNKEVVAGTESFSQQDQKMYMEYKANLCIPFFAKEAELAATMRVCQPEGKQKALLIRTSDNKNFRIYMKAEFYFSHPYLNSICRFLDTRTEGQTVTFILGTKMCDYQIHMLGGLMSSIISCKATVNTIAAGMCSNIESMIWCFGQNRDVYRYGALTFGRSDFVKFCEKYTEYFNVTFKRAVEIGVLTQEEVTEITETGREKMILYSDYKKLFPDT